MLSRGGSLVRSSLGNFSSFGVAGTYGGHPAGSSADMGREIRFRAPVSLSTSAPNRRQHSTAAANVNVKVCVIGAGAAGFYTAQHVLKSPNTVVDIYESLPVPFGLVRYGVAPDHPEVKNCIHTFTQVAKNLRCNYFGNVKLGTDVSFRQFREAYHAVVLDINLDVERCVVIGQGNVALDVARILLSPLDKIKATDITEEAVETLSRSRVKRVTLVGRRGPLQVAFTIKELRELIKLPKTLSYLHEEDFAGIDVSKMERPRKRLTELMLKTLHEQPPSVVESCHKAKIWELKFLRSPLEFMEDIRAEGRVGSVLLAVNRLEDGGRVAVPTGRVEMISSGIVLKSIGYSSSCPDDDIPFDGRKGVIVNEAGRVAGLPGVYCSGWVKTGPVGVIVSTMNGSFETGANLLKDLNSGVIDSSVSKPGSDLIVNQILKEKGVRHVTFEQWEKINAYETEMGAKKNKLADKVLSVEKMLEIAFS
ncbi:NADPH:adrenodoxin oxidoreductase [Tropilaelaps mercedesae]|uniref:NADPH:adrenodoxin oxidoreductase, mitochondrial n=1 Tax=Tropilaelaps mercedesae TaxID=418985 RepID=A0A1V9XDU9_9ACAR|nr:NADPH:adrenodoxin oxidoreductase [Tropilaelaps mercedesae]